MIIMADEKLMAAIKKAREDSKRNFKQAFDLSVNLKGIDLKKPENKVKTEIKMVHPINDSTIGVMAENLLPQARELSGVIVINKAQIEAFGKDKKGAKKLARSCSYLLAEAPLMPLVGKFLGPVLAPKNMMPSPFPPTTQNLKGIVEQKRGIVKVALKDSPTIQMGIGKEEMSDEQVAENADHALKSILAVLPKGREQVKNFIIKLTMGKPVKVVL
jgi:large subunit ribosomal protein L1